MYHITIVCITQSGDFRALYIHDANTSTIDHMLHTHHVYAIEYVLEHHVTVAHKQFKLYHTQAELQTFRDKWQLTF